VDLLLKNEMESLRFRYFCLLTFLYCRILDLDVLLNRAKTVTNSHLQRIASGLSLVFDDPDDLDSKEKIHSKKRRKCFLDNYFIYLLFVL
jgi:hypothetical protein